MRSLMLPLLMLLLVLSGRSAAGDPELDRSVADLEGRCGVREPTALVAGPRAAGAPDPGPPACFACGEPVSYRAFDGTWHSLTRYPGRFTELLLPAHWVDGDGLGDAERRLLVDRADFVYAHARELMGRDPGGDGRLQIAFVATTCGYGCGNVGSKGVEVVSSDQARSEIRGDLEAGVLPRIIVHEMAHNFDLLGRDLWQGLPSTFDSHAWTTFFDPYLQIYTRMGSTTASPDDVQKGAAASTWGTYSKDPETSWERCVAGAACGPGATPNAVWGGVNHRFAQLHGAHSVRRFLGALETLRAERGAPQSLQDKADLHFEALAAGAGSDLGCYADAWRWSISDALRTRLAAHPAEPRCADVDGDGVTPLLGDCDDDDPEVSPGAAERDNGLDDDCNGLVDDLLLTEETGGDFSGALLAFPGRARGTLLAGDSDDFWIDVPADQDVAFEVCSEGFEGFFFVYEGAGWLDWQYVGQGQCSRRSYALSKRRWRAGFEARNVSKPGAYALSVGPGTPWPAPLATASEPRSDACRVVVGAPGSPAGSAGPSDRTRFWVTGRGFVAEALQPDPGRAVFFPGAPSPAFFLREQGFDGDVPAGDWTKSLEVVYAPPEGAACGEDPDGDGIVNGIDGCPWAFDPEQTDTDADGVGDACDDCTIDADGPLRPDAGGGWQRDTDADGHGNVCDPDLDGDGVVNFRDLARMKAVFFGADPHADLDGDGVVNFRDLARMKGRMFQGPGPSAQPR